VNQFPSFSAQNGGRRSRQQSMRDYFELPAQWPGLSNHSRLIAMFRS
jgi:hypothetical protein